MLPRPIVVLLCGFTLFWDAGYALFVSSSDWRFLLLFFLPIAGILLAFISDSPALIYPRAARALSLLSLAATLGSLTVLALFSH
jgi:hypothetical protein